MKISDEQADKLKALLKACTANVQADGKSRGAAFFVSNTLLLTSHHVVEGFSNVTVVPPTGRSTGVTVLHPNPGAEHDLALLRIPLEENDPEQPAVLLDTSMDGERYFVVGFPAEAGHGPGQEGFTVSGHARTTIDNVPALLQVEAGKTITYGMSGGPVLNLETGAVVAVVRSSKNPNDALGGGAVPIAVALERYPELAGFERDAPVAVGQWRGVLGSEIWRQRGQSWEFATEIDLKLGGTRNVWKIESKLVSEEGVTRTASDLGEDLTEAMFRWAQRRRLSTQEEVELLGRLLAKALFPSAIERHLRALSEADTLTLRLHVDPVCGLADIPWELACVPESKEFVAAHQGYRLLRVDDRAVPSAPQPLPERTRVLGFTGLAAERWQYPVTSFGDEQYGWPSAEKITRGLAASLTDVVYEPVVLGEDTRQLRQRLESSQFDILHYIGVGRLSPDGRRGELSMVDPFGDPYFLDVQELLSWAREATVRVVVLEFTGPPVGQRLEPVSVSSLGELLGGGIEAVVLTRFPVHPRQFSLFNEALYDHLGRGGTLEEAVQEGRLRLKQTPVVDDWAGFGCFSLITDGSSEVRMTVPHLSAREVAPREQSARQAAQFADAGKHSPLDSRPERASTDFVWKQ